jgi:HEAT repeat protein
MIEKQHAVMAHAPKTEDCLEALSKLRQDRASPAACVELPSYLAHKSNLVVAKAAKLVAEFELQDMGRQLVEAFHRFMKNPATTDRGCAAKTEIVRALEALGASEEEVFLAGIRHVQMEGSFGPPVDTAAGLRVASAMGLVRMNHPDAIFELVALLVDREADARVGAVRALAYSGRLETVALLRLKALGGDESVDVLAECFTALLAISPARSQEFVAKYLDAGDAAVAEAAALALGQSRQPAAIETLKSRWSAGAGESLRPALLMGLALARDESAFEFLFSLVETAVEKVAAEALAALAVYRHDDRIRSRVESLAAARKGKLLRQAFDLEFGPRHA